MEFVLSEQNNWAKHWKWTQLLWSLISHVDFTLSHPLEQVILRPRSSTDNHVGGEGGVFLGQAMKTNTTLTAINLFCLDETMMKMTQTRFIARAHFLSDNWIGCEGECAFICALLTNTTLTDLGLKWVSIHDLIDSFLEIDTSKTFFSFKWFMFVTVLIEHNLQRRGMKTVVKRACWCCCVVLFFYPFVQFPSQWRLTLRMVRSQSNHLTHA